MRVQVVRSIDGACDCVVTGSTRVVIVVVAAAAAVVADVL